MEARAHPRGMTGPGVSRVPACPASTTKSGFTLIEIMIAVGTLLVAVLIITSIIVPLNRQREQVEALRKVMAAARSQVEEIKGIDPAFIEATYDGQTYGVAGIDGANADGSTLRVIVDSKIPALLVVTVSAAWNVGHIETLELTTEIYNPRG